MEGLGGSGSGSGVMGSVFGSGNAPKVQAAAPKKVNISAGVAVGMLLQKTQPIYPPIAKAARVSGTVVLQATISKSGTIDNLRVISGPAMLQQAAMDAVRTWRYRPYLLNNEPVEVETTINVIFSLGG
jgi:protein TonB